MKIQRYVDNILKTNGRIKALTSHFPKEKFENIDSLPSDVIGVVVKDNFCTTELPTTCASKALENYVSPYESTCTQLLKDAGTVFLGKANMDEFAMGSNNQYTHFGQVINPAFEEPRSPGGSSGGSAAAVAAEYCDVATGTDTGGSVRLPAAYCSVLGFKPTYGLLSRHGIVSYAQSFDTVGLLAREFEPLQRVFDILNVHDSNDPTSLPNEIRETFKKRGAEKLNIGVINESIVDVADSVREEWTASLEYLESLGHTIHFVDAPSFKYSLHTYFMLAPSEASSNLARYDGVRYGAREESNDADELLYAATRTENLGHEVRRRILLGTYNLTSGTLKEHFFKAQQMRGLMVTEFNSIFKSPHPLEPSASGEIDVIVLPTGRNLPPLLEDLHNTDPVDDYVNDILTVPANIAGLPAISVPTKVPGIGMQVWGQFGEDQLVLDVAQQLHTR